MRRFTLVVLSLLAAASVSAESAPFAASSWSLNASPTFGLPLLAGDGGSDPVFSQAWGASLSARTKLVGPLSLRMETGWATAGIRDVSGVSIGTKLSEFSLFAGAGLTRSLASRLSVDAFACGGGGFGTLSTGATAFYPAARGGLGLDFLIAAGFGTRFEAYYDYKAGLYSGLGIGLGLTWNPPERSAGREELLRLFELRLVELAPVFPILRAYYDEQPLGKVLVANKSRKAVNDVRLSFYAKSFMDAPKECAVIPSIEAGASVEVPVTALFNEQLLNVTEPTKALAEIGLTVDGVRVEAKTVTVSIQDRTALTWDDDRKAAAFVSSKDPWVLDLVGNINSTIRNVRNAEVPKNLQSAIALHEGLLAYGLGYLASPNRPFAQGKVDTRAVDNLKFPRQTFSDRSGDCADLSVLYASCLEAMGIETAFVTVPGHIFIAADLGISAMEASARGVDPALLVVRNGRAWVPIETTIRDKGFLDAWRSAAAQWENASAKGSSALLPVHDAWSLYAPVGLPADGSRISLPAKEAVLALFKSELDKIVRIQLASRVASLGPIPEKGAAGKALNDRGVLYGRYGLLSEAERDFRAAAKIPYGPAIVNLGNVAFLKGDADTAFRAFKQAQAAAPKDPKILANLIKAAAALGKSDEAAGALAALKAVDPSAASRYSSVAQAGSGTTRAAEAGDDFLSWF